MEPQRHKGHEGTRGSGRTGAQFLVSSIFIRYSLCPLCLCGCSLSVRVFALSPFRGLKQSVACLLLDHLCIPPKKPTEIMEELLSHGGTNDGSESSRDRRRPEVNGWSPRRRAVAPPAITGGVGRRFG